MRDIDGEGPGFRQVGGLASAAFGGQIAEFTRELIPEGLAIKVRCDRRCWVLAFIQMGGGVGEAGDELSEQECKRRLDARVEDFTAIFSVVTAVYRRASGEMNDGIRCGGISSAHG